MFGEYRAEAAAWMRGQGAGHGWRAEDGLRVACGAIFLVTALAWLIPPLVPFIPAQVWHDPMAARLMAAFDLSGLTGAAKGIHVAAGLALILNRAAPLALAAAMPVNVCGAFIAVLVEGTPLGAALALALVALNGVLMLLDLPAYRAMLSPAALADGEGAEPGAHYNSLFVNPLAGAPLKACLVAALSLLAAAAFYWKVVLGLNSLTGLVVLVVPALALLVAGVRARS